jgi:hypothetical protein
MHSLRSTMTKELTPMKRYAHQLQEFRHYLPSGFKEVQLNKKAEKYAYAAGESYHDKGVENDFVMIFKTPFNDISFAFAFSFQDLPLDKQHVFASIKKGKDNSSIQNSMPLTILEFKEKINTFNSWAKETIDQKPYR